MDFMILDELPGQFCSTLFRICPAHWRSSSRAQSMNANAEKIAIPAAISELPSAASMASAPDIDSKVVRSRFENPINQVIGIFAFQLETRIGVFDEGPRPVRSSGSPKICFAP